MLRRPKTVVKRQPKLDLICHRVSAIVSKLVNLNYPPTSGMPFVVEYLIYYYLIFKLNDYLPKNNIIIFTKSYSEFIHQVFLKIRFQMALQKNCFNPTIYCITKSKCRR